MKLLVLFVFSFMVFQACALELAPAQDPGVSTYAAGASAPAPALAEVVADSVPHAEALTVLGCQTKADLAAKAYLQWAANATDAEMHWYSEGYWQVGGAAFHQTVRARAYWQQSTAGTRTARLDFCHDNQCSYYGTYTCKCSGSCSF